MDGPRGSKAEGRASASIACDGLVQLNIHAKLPDTHRGLSPRVLCMLLARREGSELLRPRAAGEAVRIRLGEDVDEGERVRDCLEAEKECRGDDPALRLLLLVLLRGELEEEEGVRRGCACEGDVDLGGGGRS